MKQLSKANDDKMLMFEELVRLCPGGILRFFDTLEEARGNLSLAAEIEVLNAVAEEEYKSCAGGAGSGETRSTVLMKWFEIFRDIYILHRQLNAEGEREFGKRPNNFSTFARTFEPLAFLPDFWFVADRNVAAKDLRGRAHGLRLAFERYFYEREGGGAWGAMDWEMNRFLQKRVYEVLKSDEAGALRRIAAVALTARAVAAGELGLYIEERDDVTLPLSGISNVWNDPQKPNSLLKYYHYDRFTQLSFAREHEFAMDPNVPGTHVRFERQWMALAVISDVILKESDAHSTNAAATRVMLESVSQCMLKIKAKLPRRKGAHSKVRKAVETLYQLVTIHPEDFAKLTESALLKKIGVSERPMPACYYLQKCKFKSAEDFWKQVLPIFNELQAAIDCNRDRIVAKYTEEQRRGGYKDAASSLTFVRDRIAKDAMSELPGEVKRNDIRNAIKALMLEGSVTLQYATMDAVLTGGDKPLGRRVQVWSEDRRAIRELPDRIPFAVAETAEFRKWILTCLSELSSQCAESVNRERRDEKAAWDRAHGSVPKRRERFPPVKPIDYRKVDFAEIAENAAKLWNFYFTEDEICLNRWIVSIDCVLKAMDDPEVRRHRVAYFNKTFSWPCERNQRLGLRQRLESAKARLVRTGRWPADIEKLKDSLLKQPSCTIDDLMSGESRILIMVAILARLMVSTALASPDLWERDGDLFAFYTHILLASNHDFDLPFPWHLDVASGSYLRTGRTHSRQGNVTDDLIAGEFYDESERTAFIVFVAHYLARQSNPSAIIDAIIGSPAMLKYFADGDVELAKRRLAFLKAYFA